MSGYTEIALLQYELEKLRAELAALKAENETVCWTRIEEGGWLDSDRTIDTDYENARRITACVNACVGISTENLEDNVPIQELARRYNETLKQRDELLAFAEEVRRSGDTRLASMAIAAIARAKGEQ